MRVLNTTAVVLTIALLVGLCSSPEPASAQWGDLKGQVIFIGTPPKPEVVVPVGQATKDPKVCAAKRPIYFEDLVVDPKSAGIANCVIYLQRKPAKIHPSLLVQLDEEIKVRIKNCTYDPHVLVVHKDQLVRVLNDDDCGHNTKLNMIRNRASGQLLAPNDRKLGMVFRFRAAEFLPMKVECNIHPWMSAYWYVVDHPYAVVTDSQGYFEIKNLPTGTHKFKVWQESIGYIERELSITVEDKQVTEQEILVDAARFDEFLSRREALRSRSKLIAPKTIPRPSDPPEAVKHPTKPITIPGPCCCPPCKCSPPRIRWCPKKRRR